MLCARTDDDGGWRKARSAAEDKPARRQARRQEWQPGVAARSGGPTSRFMPIFGRDTLELEVTISEVRDSLACSSDRVWLALTGRRRQP